MRPGQAIAQTLKAPPDFYGDKHAVTLSPGGTGRLIDCRKCSACGWSVTGTPTVTQNQIHEIATSLERLCIEYACQSRVNGVSNETRAVWRQFKAQIEALKVFNAEVKGDTTP